ncbi:ATP-binding protein (plasmid) [Rhodococcus sp. ZPP]|uniref:AAA family ATPase n=1 Tax=Rhodococcus TaxID=1827 RepID=UPI001AD87D5B|nr:MULTISPECIES: ATP-binding protein [Rhodococcus]MBO8150835.1 ATP-binding protein [Rhodococcus erythropolis]QTJ71000.1 ATP-binding protein [Rhodococcus sp. ZPP]
MARADLLLDLVDAERRGDRDRFRVLVESVIAEERANQHHLLADRLSEILTTSGTSAKAAVRDDHSSSVQDLVHEIVPRRRLSDLQLDPVVQRVITELAEEQKRSELLRSYGLEPRNRLLLSGPPGNGKTSVAEAIASELMLPFYVVRYEGVVSSFLGETAARLDHAFEFARTRRCVLFFDELDTIAKERADQHETGEIKRVVSTLLLQIDRLPAHVILVGATNHGELLDRAAWRRFQVRAELRAPSRVQATKYLEILARRFGGDLGYTPRTIADKLAGASYAEIEEFAQDVRRRAILEQPDADLRRIVQERLEHWRIQATE